jgi:hypothetical protein
MDARTEGACPVCAEPLPDRPDRCFRCETPLLPWWGFEDALRQVAEARTPAAAAGPRRTWVAGSALIVMALVVAAAVVVTRRSPAPVVVAPTEPAAPVAPSPERPPDTAPATFSYRVQHGDSLWRIAAGLTGDGRRWRALWPEHASGDGRIGAGAVLQVDARRLAAAAP